MKTKLLFWALVAIALGACTNENENFPSDSNEDVVVLKERVPNSPLILFQRQYTPLDPTTRATKLTFSDYLGFSGHSVMNSFSFASFDRYLEKSQVSKKVNSGFSINLGLFSIGHKKR